MRIPYNTTYTRLGYNHNNIADAYGKTSLEIASGKKISAGYEAPVAFLDNLRLEYEQTTLNQVKDVSEKAQLFSLNTDDVLSQMTTAFDAFKVKMVNAGSAEHSKESYGAIASEMEGLKDHITSLANSSINGKSIFSGTAVEKKAINDDGSYNGNDGELKAVVGAYNKITYNITGKELFYGQDSDSNKKITTNVRLYNQTILHPDVMTKDSKSVLPDEQYIKTTDTIRVLVGDIDDGVNNQSDTFFYIRGRANDGTTFKDKFALTSENKVEDLLTRIGESFGNTSTREVVKVTLNDWGQIEITDKIKGNSVLDFSMVAGTDMPVTKNVVYDVDLGATNTTDALSTKTTTNPIEITGKDKNGHNVNISINNNQTFQDLLDALEDIDGIDKAELKIVDINGDGTDEVFIEYTGNNSDNLNLQIDMKIAGKDLKNSQYSVSEDTKFDLSLNGANNATALNTLTDTDPIQIAGTDRDGNSINLTVANTGTMQDLIDEVNKIDGVYSASIVNDKLVIKGAKDMDISIDMTLKAGTDSGKNLGDYIINNKANVNDIDELAQNGIHITDFTKSGFTVNRTQSQLTVENDRYDHRISTFPTTLKLKSDDTTIATANNGINTVLGTSDGDTIDFTIGKNSDGSSNTYTFTVGAGNDGSTLQKTLDFIESKIENDLSLNPNTIQATIDNGKITITDTSIEKDDFSKFTLSMEVKSGVNPKVSFANDFGTSYDKVRFSKDGSNLSSNVSQVLKDTNEYAKMDTKLQEVAGSPLNANNVVDLNGETFEMLIKDTNGVEKMVKLTLDNNGSYFEIDTGNDGTFENLIDTDGNNVKDSSKVYILKPDSTNINNDTKTPANEVTYQQLSDVISMAMTNTIPATTNGTNDVQLDEYASGVKRARRGVDVFLDSNGKFNIHDKSSKTTKAEFSFYDTKTDNFSGFNLLDNKIIDNNKIANSSSMTFQANDTVVVDDPHLDIFHQMDDMIEAVRNGMVRSDGDNAINSRSIGIQNSIGLLDHMYSHITETHTKNGAQSKMLEYTIDRSQVLLINVMTTKSAVIDTDIGEATMRFKQLELNYQAVLSTISKISALSMVNYYK